VDMLIMFNLVLTSYLIIEVYRLRKVIQERDDRKKATLESNLMKASTLLKTGKADEANEVVDRMLKS